MAMCYQRLCWQQTAASKDSTCSSRPVASVQARRQQVAAKAGHMLSAAVDMLCMLLTRHCYITEKVTAPQHYENLDCKVSYE